MTMWLYFIGFKFLGQHDLKRIIQNFKTTIYV